MELQVKTLNKDGSIAFDGILRQREVTFVLGIGINFLLANGASPFIQDDEEDAEEGGSMVVDGPTTAQ